MKFYTGTCPHGKRGAAVVVSEQHPGRAAEFVREMIQDGLIVNFVEAEKVNLERCDICRAAYLKKEIPMPDPAHPLTADEIAKIRQMLPNVFALNHSLREAEDFKTSVSALLACATRASAWEAEARAWREYDHGDCDRKHGQTYLVASRARAHTDSVCKKEG